MNGPWKLPFKALFVIAAILSITLWMVFGAYRGLCVLRKQFVEQWRLL